MTEHIVAVFGTEEDATAARRSVESAGVPSSAIRQYGENDHVGIAPASHSTAESSGGGFWAWLFGEDTTSRSAYTHDTYDRRASSGQVVLSVRADDEVQAEYAIAALEAHNPLDIDEGSHETGYGRTGMAPPVGLSTSGQEFSTGEVARSGATASYPSGRADPTIPTEAMSEGVIPAPATPKGEEVIPLAEEQLKVGKRTVDRGTMRIRRYVVEKPVEETVALRGERVTVERRTPIDTGTPGAAAFEERVVEVRETAEEPVIAKTAKVVEEVVVGREATERTETVRDTVRREEVEVSRDGEMKRDGSPPRP